MQERIATVTPSLPTWAAPPVMLQPMSATSRVMKIGLSPRHPVDMIDLSMTAYWKIRARLLRVPGVANVADLGRAPAACCRCRSTRSGWASTRVTLEQVMSATSDALDAGLLPYSQGHFIGRGRLDRPPTNDPACDTSSRSSRRGPGTGPDRRPTTAVTVRLGDVADVVGDHQPLIGDAVINGGPA